MAPLVSSSANSAFGGRMSDVPVDAARALADEVQQQRTAMAETAERLDFVERALVQLRDTGQKPAGP